MTMCVCGHSMDSHNPAYDDVWVCMICNCGDYKEQKTRPEVPEPVPARHLRPARCDACGDVLDMDTAHFRHDLNCDRALNGFCRCDGGWVCASHCRDSGCCRPASQLHEQLRAAHLEQLENAE